MSVLQVVDRKLSIDPAEEGIFSKSHGQIVFTHTTTTIMHGQWTNTAVKVKGQQLWTLAVRAPGGLTSSKGPFSSIAATTSSIILFGQIPVRFENLIMTRLESDCRWRRMASEEHTGGRCSSKAAAEGCSGNCRGDCHGNDGQGILQSAAEAEAAATEDIAMRDLWLIRVEK